MNLIIGLAAVDEATGGKQMRQLADGWMGRESRLGQRLQALRARASVVLATKRTASTSPGGTVRHGGIRV
jgi:hypothetical protein